jgi:hypothetical protein
MKQLLENWRRFVNEAVEKPKLIFLVGPPAVGKSTWVEKNVPGDFLVLNRDDIVEKIARESGVGTYDDMYKRPPKEILPQPLPGPEDPQKVEQYLNSLKSVADKFNAGHPEETKQFGPVEPFTVENYIKAITPRTERGWGVPLEYFVPLYYPKINDANEAIKNDFENARNAMAKDKKDVIIDMVNMSKDERDGHRMAMVAAITNMDLKNISEEEATKIINDKFVQEAYVFAPDKTGYDEETKEKIKQVAQTRAAEIAAEPGRSKTIPPQAYDRFFGQYSAPDKSEGYSVIKYVGIPSLG